MNKLSEENVGAKLKITLLKWLNKGHMSNNTRSGAELLMAAVPVYPLLYCTLRIILQTCLYHEKHPPASSAIASTSPMTCALSATHKNKFEFCRAGLLPGPESHRR